MCLATLPALHGIEFSEAPYRDAVLCGLSAVKGCFEFGRGVVNGEVEGPQLECVGVCAVVGFRLGLG